MVFKLIRNEGTVFMKKTKVACMANIRNIESGN